MTSGVSWNELGLDPEVQRGAGDAARRAGLSSSRSSSGLDQRALDELSQRIGGSGRSNVAAAPITSSRSRGPLVRNRRQAQRPSGADDHRRAEPQGQGCSTARSTPARRDHGPQAMPEPSDLGSTKSSPEIAARQRMLDEAPARAPPASTYANLRPPDFSSLEQQLHNITRQIETLRHPSGSRTRCPDCVATLAASAAPSTRRCRAARSKRSRAKSTRSPSGSARGTGAGGDPSCLETIERGLARVHSALNEMTQRKASPVSTRGFRNSRQDQ